MKTIIIKGAGYKGELNTLVAKIEKYTDKVIKDAVVCTRYLNSDNFHTIHGELRDATSMDDFDVFIVADTDGQNDLGPLKNTNKTKTLVCEVTDIESIKNYIVTR